MSLKIDTPKVDYYAQDVESLDNLAKYTSDKLIDIYENGTISTPYDKSIKASFWRTTRAVSGLSGNSEDIPKIQKLITRGLSHYSQGFLKKKIKHSTMQ